MDPKPVERKASGAEAVRPVWVRPDYEVVSLACEISAYAPAEGDPLF
jgi:hypothetical protein